MMKRQSKVAMVMREWAAGELHSGGKRGPKVKSRKQAMAIALGKALPDKSKPADRMARRR